MLFLESDCGGRDKAVTARLNGVITLSESVKCTRTLLLRRKNKLKSCSDTEEIVNF